MLRRAVWSTIQHTRATKVIPKVEMQHHLCRADSVTEAWQAYQTLLSISANDVHGKGNHFIPYTHLHSLARLLASTKPRTRTLFLQLSSVLKTIRNTGGTIHLWEWNALMDCAGKGWRKASMEDYKNALDIFNGMVNDHNPELPHMEYTSENFNQKEPIKPDIVSYTTLLYIAGRSLEPAAIRHASSLLASSGLPPNRITHLSLLGYFSRTNQLSGVRATLLKMREQRLSVGVDGINACIWAYAQNKHMDVASIIYRVLRHNFIPEADVGENDIDMAINYLRDEEGIIVPDNAIPNEITYTSMIQALSYQGNLMRALQVFVDMLSSPNLEPKAISVGEEPKFYTPTMAAFRGIFLGFARHGHKKPRPPTLTAKLGSVDADWDWDLNNLHILFKAFLDLPPEPRPSERLVHWIMVAFAKTSGSDPRKMRTFWSQFERKFGGGWGGRIERLRRRIYAQDGNDDPEP